MFRKVLFWLHLSCGVGCGLVVLMMSVTGVVLTYERQMLAAADKVYYYTPGPDQSRLALDQLVSAGAALENFELTSITLAADPSAPAVLRAGRRDSRHLNPYTGDIYPPREQALDEFFSVVTRIHRWFNASGDSRDIGRAVTGVSNLMFLFLIVSGLYLWLPKVFRWTAFRLRLWFQSAPNAAARDFNWHHVLGIWCALPLVVIVSTATVFNYSWANNLVYRLAGEEPPARGARPAPTANADNGSEQIASETEMLPLETLFQTASGHLPAWTAITVTLPEANSSQTVSFAIDQGNGGQPQKRHTLVVDARSGEVAEWLPFASQSPGRQARSWVRFLHTGEALGIVGQTVAGLASLAAVLMVWTGLALAWRRFMRFLARQRRGEVSGEATISS